MRHASKENIERTVVDERDNKQSSRNNGDIHLSFYASSSKYINRERGQNGYEVDPKTPGQEEKCILALRLWLARKQYLLMPLDLPHLLKSQSSQDNNSQPACANCSQRSSMSA